MRNLEYKPQNLRKALHRPNREAQGDVLARGFASWVFFTLSSRFAVFPQKTFQSD
jgi:hypothetical protein